VPSGSAKPPKAEASWFPGHMAAGLRSVVENAAVIDAVIEVRDARIPRATAATGLHPSLSRKRRIVLLNREDLADPEMTDRWLAQLSRAGITAFAGVGTHAVTLKGVRNALLSQRPREGRLRAAVIGAPNTGKSSVINALGRRKRAVAQAKAGVTRQVRWLTIGDAVELLDTPGILAPKITSAAAAWQLALCGSLPDSAFDAEEVVAKFGEWLRVHRPADAEEYELSSFARRHGMIRRGGEIDARNAARKLIARFRDGALPKITFESPE
jgi:ribosome biogenesis GTPase A